MNPAPGAAPVPVATPAAATIATSTAAVASAANPFNPSQLTNIGLQNPVIQLPGVGIGMPVNSGSSLPLPAGSMPPTTATTTPMTAAVPPQMLPAHGVSGHVPMVPHNSHQPSPADMILQKRKRGRPPGSSKKIRGGQPPPALPVPNGPPAPHLEQSSVIPSPAGPSSLMLFNPNDPGSAGKKPRGRPRGSATRRGLPLLPYIIQVQPGQDIVAEIARVARQQECGACMLAANGAVVGATLQHQFGGMVTVVKGPLEIITLTGVVEVEDVRGTRTGFLNASLSATGGIVAGTVVGSICAATPVQVVLGLMTNGNSGGSAASAASEAAGGEEKEEPTAARPVAASSAPPTGTGTPTGGVAPAGVLPMQPPVVAMPPVPAPSS